MDFFLLGLLAGWSNENVGIIVAIVSCTIVYTTYLRNNKIPQWALWAALACAVGWIILMIAPGNYIRMSHGAFAAFYENSMWKRILNNILLVTSDLIHFFTIPTLIILYTITHYRNTLKTNIQLQYCIFFFIISLLLCCPFVLSPTIPRRTLTATGLFICISMYISIFMIKQKIRFIVIIPLLVFLTISLYSNVILFYNNSKITAQRNSILFKQQSKDVEIPAYIGANKYFFIGEKNEIEDASVDASNWTNVLIKNKFNVSSVVLKNTIKYNNIDSAIFTSKPTVYYLESSKSTRGLIRYYFRIMHGPFTDEIQDEWMLKLYFKRGYSPSDIQLHSSSNPDELFYYIGDSGTVLRKVFYHN